MNVFAVMIHEPDKHVLQRLAAEYGDGNVYPIASTTLLVQTKDLAEQVAVAAGIKGEERSVSGIVFKLNRAYAGFTSRALWEWLTQVEI